MPKKRDSQHGPTRGLLSLRAFVIAVVALRTGALLLPESLGTAVAGTIATAAALHVLISK